MGSFLAEHVLRWLPLTRAVGADAATPGADAAALQLPGGEACMAEPAAADEHGMVARIRAGERAAVAQVYDAHHEALRGLAQRLLGDLASAEDLVHDVFVALPQAIVRFRGDCSLRSFLISIAINQTRRHVRSAQRRRRALQRYSELPPPGPSAACPEREFSLQQDVEALRAGLLALPVAQSAAFVLCEIEHLPTVEVAQILGVPEATVRTRLWNARRRLRQLLSEGSR